ncbi:hypothetical protein B0H13DRAFT_2428988, partial [Mycena leptocephala]
ASSFCTAPPHQHRSVPLPARRLHLRVCCRRHGLYRFPLCVAVSPSTGQATRGSSAQRTHREWRGWRDDSTAACCVHNHLCVLGGVSQDSLSRLVPKTPRSSQPPGVRCHATHPLPVRCLCRAMTSTSCKWRIEIPRLPPRLRGDNVFHTSL